MSVTVPAVLCWRQMFVTRAQESSTDRRNRRWQHTSTEGRRPFRSLPRERSSAPLAVMASKPGCPPGRVRSHVRFRNRGNEYVSEYGITWRWCKATMRTSPTSWARGLAVRSSADFPSVALSSPSNTDDDENLPGEGVSGEPEPVRLSRRSSRSPRSLSRAPCQHTPQG